LILNHSITRGVPDLRVKFSTLKQHEARAGAPKADADRVDAPKLGLMLAGSRSRNPSANL
jgi:hypothetical protein